ncbi:MAG: sigma factor, partial [Acidimicrobiales bacterium]
MDLLANVSAVSQSRRERRQLAEDIADLRPSLHRYARSLAGNDEEAADLTQAALAAALQSSSRFTPGTNLTSWTFRIVHNLHLNRRRSATRAARWLDAGGLDDDAMAADAPLD